MSLQRGLLFIIFVGLALSTVLFDNSFVLTQNFSPLSSQAEPTTDEELPEYQVANFSAFHYNDRGQIESIIKAGQLSSYKSTGNALLDLPKIQLFTQNHQQADWYIKSNKAKSVQPNTDILLTEQVIMKKLATQQEPTNTTILTDEIWLLTEKKIAESDKKVTILSDKNEITGTGLKATLDTNAFTLKNNVSSRYQARPEQNNTSETLIKADRLTVVQAAQKASYRGNVILVHDNIVINADRIDIVRHQDSHTAYAFGEPALFEQSSKLDKQTIKAQAKKLEFNNQAQKLNMYGDARLEQNNTVVEGDYLYYDTHKEIIGAESKQNGRVKMTLPNKSSGSTN